MKKYAVLFLASAFLFNVAVSAQDQMPPQKKEGSKKEFKERGDKPGKHERPEMTAKKRAGYLAVDLDLTDAQKEKVQALFEKQDKIRAERKAEMAKLKEQRKAKMEAERKANDAEMEKILGTEKFQQFKAKQAERMEKMKKMRDRGPRNGNGEGRPFKGQHRQMPAEHDQMPK